MKVEKKSELIGKGGFYRRPVAGTRVGIYIFNMLIHTILVDKFSKYKFGQKTEQEEGSVCRAKIT
jgi:hypothetical protein